MTYYVYTIAHVSTGRLYIGFSSNVHKRWIKHQELAKSSAGSYIHAALRKYGFEKFEFKVLQEFLHKEDALSAERYWISFFRSNEKDYGFNLTEGGECWSPETCQAGGKAAGGKTLKTLWINQRDHMIEHARKNGQRVGKIAGQTWLLAYNKSEIGRQRSAERLKRYTGTPTHRQAVSESNRRRCLTGACGHKSHRERRLGEYQSQQY